MGDLAKLLGEPIGGQVAQQVALRGIKAAALATRPSPSQDKGYAFVDFDTPTYKPSGVRAVAFVPGAYADEPELFYGPFAQVGTYLKGKGVIQSEGLAFAMDLALDPLNLVSFGTAGAAEKLTKGAITGLTDVGKLSRLVSAVTEGGKFRSGVEVVDRVTSAVEAAGKLAGASEDILKAAQAGNDAALKQIVHAALAAPEVPEGVRTTLEALKRDRKALGQFLDHLDDFKSMHELPAEAFLQDTTKARLAAGQVEPLVSVVNPFQEGLSAPLRNPLRFTRQMLGFHYANERFALPMSRQAVEGLEKVGAGSLFEIAGGVKPVGEVRLETKFAAQHAEDEAFKAAGFTAGDLDAAHAVMAMHMARVLPASPTDRLYVDFGYDAVHEDTLKGAFERLVSKEDRTPEAFEKFKLQVTEDMNGARRAVDQERLRYRNDLMDQMTGEYRRAMSADPATQAGESLALSEAQQDVMASQMRRAFDVFSIKSLQMDAFSPGNGLAARASFQSLMARLTLDNTRAVVKGAYRGRLAREAISELPAAIISHPNLFELRDGKFFLTASREQMKEAGAAFLEDLIYERSPTSKATRFLETHLRTEGLNPEVTKIVQEMKTTYDMIGKNLVANEGILKGFHDDYFSRVWRWSEKGRKEAPLAAEAMRMGNPMSDDAERQLTGLMMGDDIKVMADRANQGKVTFEEARKQTEAQMLRLEKLGYGTFEKDAVAVFSGYLEASGKSVLINRLWRDMPDIAGFVTRGAMGKRGPQIEDAVLRLHRRIMATEPSNAMLPFYKQMYVRPRILGPGDDPETLAKTLIAERELKAAEETARRRVAAQFEGKTTVAGYRIRDKVTGEAVPFRGEWVLTDSIPDSIAGSRALKGKVAETIDSSVVLQRLRDQVAKGRATIEGKAAKALESAKGAQVEAQRGGLWVFEDDYNHIAEAFGIRDKPSSAFFRAYDRWNSNFKSVVLIGDVFHFNVLAISQSLLNPTALIKNLYDDAGKLLPGVAEGGFNLGNAAVKAGLGAVAGAGIGAVSGQDERGIATFSLVGGLYGAVIGAAMNNARTGLRAAMNPANIDTLHWMGVGGWRGRPDDRSIGILNRSLRLLRDKLARDPDNGALISAIDGVRHVADAWDHTLWETLHNGSKHHYFQVKWAQELPKLEGRAGYAALSEAEQFALKSGLAREIVQTSNNVFGGQTMRFLFDNPEFQHVARRFLLSPDWTSSRLALASGFMMNMDPAKQALIGAGLGIGVQAVEHGGDPDKVFDWRGPVLGAGLGLALGKWAGGIARRMGTPGDVMAKEARRVTSAALLGGYVFANAVNYGLTGRWLFQNPEGRKTSIDIGGGNWVQLGKPWVEPFEFAGIYEPGKNTIPVVSRFVSKGATVPVAALRILANQNQFGGPLILPDDSPWEIASKIVDVTIPIPILGAAPAKLGLGALQGAATRQQVGQTAIRAMGFPVRGPGSAGPMPNIDAFQNAMRGSAPPPLVGAPSLLESKL